MPVAIYNHNNNRHVALFATLIGAQGYEHDAYRGEYHVFCHILDPHNTEEKVGDEAVDTLQYWFTLASQYQNRWFILISSQPGLDLEGFPTNLKWCPVPAQDLPRYFNCDSEFKAFIEELRK